MTGLCVAIPTATADRVYVSQQGSHQSPFVTWAQAATNLQAAVDAAQAGAEIVLRKGVYTGSGMAAVATITHSVVLRGEGDDPEAVIVDGEHVRRGILVQVTNAGARVLIEGVTVRNGRTSRETLPPSGRNAHGAGIYVDHTAVATGNVELRNCRLHDNVNQGPHGHNEGGGLASRGVDGSGFQTIVMNCAFIGNTVSNRGGVGGGAAFRNTRLTLEKCRFEGNRSVGEKQDSYGHERPGEGGGLYAANAPSGSVIRSCIFTDNTCGGGSYSKGGGLSLEGADTAIIVENNLFENSRARYAGAVSLGHAGRLTLRNCRLLNGDAEAFRRWSDAAVCHIENCVIEGRVWPGGAKNFTAHDARKDPAFILDEEGNMQPVRTLADWARRRAEAIGRIERAAGPLPERSLFPAAEWNVLADEVIEGRLRRQLIAYNAETRDAPRIKAWLFSPSEASVLDAVAGGRKRHAAVLCLHQTNRSIGKNEPAGINGSPDYFYALELARRGFVTLAPDFTGSGEHPGLSSYSNNFASATMKGISDHIRAVDLLCGMPGVAPARIGCIGHSLGGFNTMMVSVFEPRIKAVVSSCGYVNWQAYADREGSLYLMAGANYMPRLSQRYASHPGLAPFDWHEVVAALAPRPLFVNAPLRDDPFLVEGVCETIEDAMPIYALYGATEAIETTHPDCGHGFPPEVRKQAYAFLEKHLAE